MNRTVEIFVDKSSWKARAVPPALAKLTGPYVLSMLEALIHTALWTRPPVFHGFALGDFWACLRYLPAIGSGPELRLRPEWSDIDAHQKTVMSDEVAVGAVTSVLANRLGCLDFVETKHALRALGRQFALKPSKKKGPDKSPDYISRLPSGKYVILECKGTQTSRSALDKSLEKGKVQKKNLKCKGATRVFASVVGGLFVPQASSTDAPIVKFVDPEWADVAVAIDEEAEERVSTAITQMACAKALSIGGFIRAANAMAAGLVDELDEREQLVRSALAVDVAPVTDAWLFQEAEGNPVVAVVKADASDLVRTLRRPGLLSAVQDLSFESRKSEWQSETSARHAIVRTPLGLRVSVELFDASGLLPTAVVVRNRL